MPALSGLDPAGLCNFFEIFVYDDLVWLLCGHEVALAPADQSLKDVALLPVSFRLRSGYRAVLIAEILTVF